MSKLNVIPGLSVEVEHEEGARAEASLRPQPQTPQTGHIELVLSGKAYGHAEFEQTIQLQVLANGTVQVLINESDLVTAVVVNDAVQVYPAP